LLKKQLDWFDGLRDAHVQILLLDKLAMRFAAARRFQGEVRQREQECLREADQRLRRFKPARLRRALDRIRQEIKERRARGLEAHDLAIAHQALARAFADTLRRRRKVDRRNRATIHRTRIAFKHYRYVVEALVPLLRGVSQEQLQAMHDHQTLMGKVQDLEVLSSTFAKTVPPGERTTPSSRAFRKELRHRLRAAVNAYWARADDLLKFKPE
jgi:CHAD domain-containing protein